MNFGNIKVKKHKFHQYKNPISIYDVNIDRIVVSNKVLFGKQGFKNLLDMKMVTKKLILYV